MTHLNDVKLDVEAILLNSEGRPDKEIFSAMLGILKFARTELDLTEQDFITFAQAAWNLSEDS